MALPPPSPESTCLITGASSGIGADIARELTERGHGVTLVARRITRLRELAKELRQQYGIRVVTLAHDIAEPDERQRMIAAIADKGLAVDVLVNNAGFGSSGRFQELDGDAEIRMVRTNGEAVVALCAAYVRPMVERGRGAILNVASIAGFQPVPSMTTYAASKAFVLHFSQALHADLAGTGVSATALCPGPVRTEFGEVAGAGGATEDSPSFLWMSSSATARAGVSALEDRRRVVVPGLVNQISALGGQHIPRAVLFRVAGRLNPFTA